MLKMSYSKWEIFNLEMGQTKTKKADNFIMIIKFVCQNIE